MAVFYEMDDVPFKPQAYERAAHGIEDQGMEKDDLKEIYKKGGLKALMDIPGVGQGIAKHIEDFLEKGTFAEYEKYKKKLPVNISELSAVEGVGPKMIKALWR